MERVLVDTYAAAAAARVKPATIRVWANRGKLDRFGHDRKGRTLYDVQQVMQVASFFHARTV